LLKKKKMLKGEDPDPKKVEKLEADLEKVIKKKEDNEIKF